MALILSSDTIPNLDRLSKLAILLVLFAILVEFGSKLCQYRQLEGP